MVAYLAIHRPLTFQYFYNKLNTHTEKNYLAQNTHRLNHRTIPLFFTAFHRTYATHNSLRFLILLGLFTDCVCVCNENEKGKQPQIILR